MKTKKRKRTSTKDDKKIDIIVSQELDYSQKMNTSVLTMRKLITNAHPSTDAHVNILHANINQINELTTSLKETKVDYVLLTNYHSAKLDIIGIGIYGECKALNNLTCRCQLILGPYSRPII